MCVVCKEWAAGKLTSEEALKNLGELIEATEDKDHYFSVVEKILDKEVPTAEDDEELNQNWYEETYGDD